jgi:hypothetical protein
VIKKVYFVLKRGICGVKKLFSYRGVRGRFFELFTLSRPFGDLTDIDQFIILVVGYGYLTETKQLGVTQQ